ncbi:MAG: glycosyltransferase family 4 protein, partial [Acidimicrobiales bacterium]
AVWLVLSRFAGERLAAGGLPASRMRVHPHFLADPGPRLVAPSESDLVLFVGRLVPEKGVTVAVEAWCQARPHGLELAIIGDGPLRAELVDRLPSGVRLLGQISRQDVSELMARARALLFPSLWYECQPMAVVEAMGHGLPVLASELGAIPELVGADGWGIHLPPGDVGAWAGALSALDVGDGLDVAGRSGRSRYLAGHTPAHALASLEAAYACARATAVEEVPA